MVYTTFRVLFLVWIIAAIYFAWKTSKRTGFNRQSKWEYVAAFILGLLACLGAIGAGVNYVYTNTRDAVATLLAKMKAWDAERKGENK